MPNRPIKPLSWLVSNSIAETTAQRIVLSGRCSAKRRREALNSLIGLKVGALIAQFGKEFSKRVQEIY